MTLFKNSSQKIVLYLSIVLTIFTILPILAPIFAKLGVKPLADGIYWFYQWFCHQRPWRSYHLFDYQLAMDARMMLMFGSMSIGGYIVYFKKISNPKILYAVIFTILMIIPLGVDGVVQMIAEITTPSNTLIPFYESTNLIRSVTGTFLGTGIAFGVFPFLQPNGAKLSRAHIKYIVLSFVLSLLIIPVLVFSWFITSNKYKPGNPFFDSVQRFPGYNYEITYEGGHTTINRVIKLPVDKYIQRAKLNNRYDLIQEYNKSDNNQK